MLHQFLSQFNGGLFQALHQVFWGTHFAQPGAHVRYGERSGLFGARVRCKDHCIAGLEHGQAVAAKRGRGVGHGCQCADHTYRLGNLEEAFFFVFFDDPHGF